jgi:biofilm PGA synthesis N-glycosyltransferase PgaC
MAMPLMESVPADESDAWLTRLVKAVAARPGALDKTIFELQARDWDQKPQRAVADSQLAQWMRVLQLNGVKNYGYYPDDFSTTNLISHASGLNFLRTGTLTMTDRIIAFSILCLVFGLPLGVAALFTGELILDFVFFWPLFMSVLWITGGLYFWFQLERHWSWDKDTPAPTLAGEPLISILIPCFNEGRNARETISAALDQRYENIEVIAINDGSSDNTAQVLQELAQEQPRLRVINLAENQGKRWRSRPGQRRRGDLLVCIDGDALLDRDTAAYLVAPLIQYPHVGAVTGNPRIRTRSTLIGRIQVGEFSSIIGLIKRTQRIYGRVFTVSGVIAAFRRQALADVGYWSPDMITEDIDISWKLQLRHWDIFLSRGRCAGS